MGITLHSKVKYIAEKYRWYSNNGCFGEAKYLRYSNRSQLLAASFDARYCTEHHQ
jgi:hypothetical protein